MSGGRQALVSLLRDAEDERKQAGGYRASQYEPRPGHFHGIGANGLDYGSHNWHLGFAAGVDWMIMRLQKVLREESFTTPTYESGYSDGYERAIQMVAEGE